jgi:peroxiredoxin
MICQRTIVITLLVTAALLVTVIATTRPLNNSLTKVETAPIAPNFVLQDSYGKQYSLADYRGKVVVINFWASWCPPCVSEMPSLQNAADKLAQHNISVLGIGVGENRDSVKRFLKSTPVSFPLLLDTSSEVMETWSAPSLPTTIIVNPQGRIALLALGERVWDDSEIIEQIISLKTKQH